MGLQKDDIRVIARGAFLHDIGKMAIPDKILTQARQARLPTNSTIMKEHAWYGYKIVKNIPVPHRSRRDRLLPPGKI